MKRRITEKYRHLLQAFWFAFTNGYARGYTSGKIYTGNSKALCVPGLNCYSCPGAIGACPIGSLQAILGSNAYRVSLYVTGFIALFGVLFGRLVCGFLCPFGLVQDLLYKIPFPFKKKNLPGHKWLKYTRYVIFAVFVVLLTTLVHDVTGTGIPWFCEWICPSGTLLAGLPLITLNPEFQQAIGFQFYWKLGVLLVILFASVAYYRPFCKYICPLGAIYGVFNPISTYRLVVDKEKCVSCGACQKACGMDIKTNETPNSSDCIRCLKCVSACPTGALDSSWNIARKKFEARLLPNEEPRENRFTVQTILTAALACLGSLSVVIVTFKYAVYDAFTFYQDDVYPLAALIALSVFSIVLGIIGFFLLLKSIDLYRNRSDANAIHRFREGTGMMYRIWLISLLLYIVDMIFHPSLLMAGINLIYLNPFPFLGLPLLYALTVLLEKSEESNFAKIIWWVVFILLVAVTGFSVFNGAQVLVAKLD